MIMLIIDNLDLPMPTNKATPAAIIRYNIQCICSDLDLCVELRVCGLWSRVVSGITLRTADLSREPISLVPRQKYLSKKNKIKSNSIKILILLKYFNLYQIFHIEILRKKWTILMTFY